MNDETKVETTAEKLKRLASAEPIPASDESVGETQGIEEVEPNNEAILANQVKVEEIKTELKVIPDAPEKTFHVFYHTLANCNMTLPKGGRVIFVNHRCITDRPEAIEHLQAEIALGNKRLSVKPGQEVMTTTELDPVASLRKEHFKEFKAMQAEAARKIAAGEPLSQSESEVQALTPGSTADIASLAAGSGK